MGKQNKAEGKRNENKTHRNNKRGKNNVKPSDESVANIIEKECKWAGGKD